jgi:RnfABCDGE-type electron transport complex G subunit
MVMVLTAVGVLSGSFLTSVGYLTKERIALNKQREIEKAITQVVPGTYSNQSLHEEKKLVIYGGMDQEGVLLGYAIQATGIGFQDEITFMLGINTDLTRINSLTILEQKETPGLGAKITDEESFLKYWENKDCAQPLSLRKPAVTTPEELAQSEINTITGATISSEAILNTVNISLVNARKLKEDGKLKLEGKNAR